MSGPYEAPDDLSASDDPRSGYARALARLVALDTVSPLDEPRRAACGAALAEFGCVPVGDGLFGLGDPAAAVWLYSHVDTKPPGPARDWPTPPFELRFEDGRWTGLGVSDAKFQLLNALDAGRRGGCFVLVDTCEEYDGDGAAASFIARHRPGTLVICDGAAEDARRTVYAGHLGQVDGAFALETGRPRLHPARGGGDVGGALRALLGAMDASGLRFTLTGLSAPHSERSLSLQQAAVRFDLRYGPEQQDAVDAFLAKHPHTVRQRMYPVAGTAAPAPGVAGPAASASRLGVHGPLGVERILVVAGADPDNLNHQPGEFIRPAQIGRHAAALRAVLAQLVDPKDGDGHGPRGA